MTEPDPQDLQSRIALLKGQIQRHKESTPRADDATYSHTSATHHTAYRPRHAHYPYNHHSSRFSHPPFRNKTLTINHSTNSTEAVTAKDTSMTTANNTDPIANTGQAKPDWIATSSRNAQIIRPAAYNPAIARDRILDPAAKIRKETQAIRQKLSSSELRDRHVTVDGTKYGVQAGGSKLVPIKGASAFKGEYYSDERNLGSEDTVSTPKQVVISGIPFLRSKNGNLYRSNVVKRNWNTNNTTKKSGLCKRFSNTGTCSRGPQCPYIHDASKIAICRDFLRSGTCSQGQHCDLSHDLTYERVPACVHFVRGACTKEDCPYPHIRVNPAAPVCRLFTTFGYCSKGVQCKDKHVFECPDYAEGKCSNPKCRLPHVDRAGQLRHHQALDKSTNHDSPEARSMSKVENQLPLDSGSGSDFDSENEVMMDIDDTGFSQEQDFLKF